MLIGPNIILALQVAVVAVTVLLVASLVALAGGRYRLHGRINLAFFILTLAAVLGLEVVIRFIEPEVFDYIRGKPELARNLRIHLCFSVPSLLLRREKGTRTYLPISSRAGDRILCRR